MSEDTPRFHTAEAALAYAQGQRDALREAADDVDETWQAHATREYAAKWLRARAEGVGE